MSEYVDMVVADIERADRMDIDTIFVGGGTPSLMTGGDLDAILSALRRCHNVSTGCEITIECNPNSLTESKLREYKASGVNRLSIGVQSLDDEVLREIGRLHTSDVALDAVRSAREYFDNINVDLMIGLPHQSLDGVVSDIESLAPFVTHFSVYSLILEEGTRLYDAVERGEVTLPSEDDVVQMYDFAVAVLRESGFERYEVSNFAREGAICRHNMAYWTQKDYYGFGVASHSLVKGERYHITNDLDEYIEGVRVVDRYAVSPSEAREEYLMLRLRLADGFWLDDYESRFGALSMDRLDALREKGLITIRDGNVCATDLGFHLLNYVILTLVD